MYSNYSAIKNDIKHLLVALKWKNFLRDLFNLVEWREKEDQPFTFSTYDLYRYERN